MWVLVKRQIIISIPTFYVNGFSKREKFVGSTEVNCNGELSVMTYLKKYYGTSRIGLTFLRSVKCARLYGSATI